MDDFWGEAFGATATAEPTTPPEPDFWAGHFPKLNPRQIARQRAETLAQRLAVRGPLQQPPDPNEESVGQHFDRRITSDDLTSAQALYEQNGLTFDKDSLRQDVADAYKRQALQQNLEYARTHPDSIKHIGERIPLLGIGVSLGSAKTLYDSAKAVENDTATQADYLTLARHLAAEEAEKGKGFWEKAGDISTYAPAVATEWMATGGAAEPAKQGAKWAARKILGDLAERGVGKVATTAAGLATEGLVRSAVNVPRLAEGTLERMTPQVGTDAQDNVTSTPGQHLSQAGWDTFKSKVIENTIWSAVGGKPGTNIAGDYAKGLGKVLLASEANKDAQYLAGLAPKGGALTGNVADLGPEALAFGVVEAVTKGYGKLQGEGIKPDSPEMRVALTKIADDALKTTVAQHLNNEVKKGADREVLEQGIITGYDLEAARRAQGSTPLDPGAREGGDKATPSGQAGEVPPATLPGPAPTQAGTDGSNPIGVRTGEDLRGSGIEALRQKEQADPWLNQVAKDVAEASPQSARQKAEALEKTHFDTLGQLQDAQRRETAFKDEVAKGLDKQADLKSARQQRLTLQKSLGQLERDLDVQRVIASAEETPQDKPESARDRIISETRRRQQDTAFSPRVPVIDSEALTPFERAAEQRTRETKFEDIPEQQRTRVDAIVERLNGLHDADAIRDTARVAFAGGGEDGLNALLELQEARLGTEPTRPEPASVDPLTKEFEDGVQEALVALQKAGYSKERAGWLVAERVRQADQAADAAGAGPKGQGLGSAERVERMRRGRAVPKTFELEAREQGLDPEHLHGLAKQLIEQSKPYARDHAEMMRDAWDTLRKNGISPRKIRMAEDVAGVPKLDVIAWELAGRHRGLFGDNFGYEREPQYDPNQADAAEILLDYLKKGAQPQLSEEKAYRKAIAELYQQQVNDAQKEVHQSGGDDAEFQEGLRLGQEHGEIDGRGEADAGYEAEAGHTGPDRIDEVEPGVYFSTGSSTGAGPGSGGTGRPIGPFEIVATIKKLFNLPVYVESKIQAKAQALYRAKPEAAEVNKMAAGDAPVVIHEVAHHLSKTLKLPLSWNQLPPDVARGFAQFDYQKMRLVRNVRVQEGFAEWLRMRETGQLHNLTPEQQAADHFAEKMLGAHAEVLSNLNRVRDQFSRFGQQTGSEQFAGQISKTGKPAQPELTTSETTASLLKRTGDGAVESLLDDVAAARRAEKAAISRGEKFLPGTKLSEVIATTRLRNVPDAQEMETGGVFAYDTNGKQVRLSSSLKDAVKGLSADEITQGGDLDRLMHSLRVLHDVSTDAVKRSPEQVEGARATLKELMQGDPQKARRLIQAADNVTGLFNSTLDAMALSGRITPERRDYLVAQHPFYVSEQHITEPDFRSVAPFGGRQLGEEPRTAGFLKRRSGSGEQMVNWLDALRNRYRFTAAMNNDQMKFRALLDLSQREGVGHWLNPGEPGKGTPQPVGWPKDFSKPSITGYVDGDPIRIRINDKPFYELVTGTQGDGQKGYALFKALGDVMQATRIPQIQRVGFTVLAPAWHLKNFIRDPILYAQRTVADRGTIGNLAELFHWYGKSMNFYSRALVAGGSENVTVKRPSDNIFKLMERTTGRELGWGAVSGEKSFTSRVMDGWHGFFQRVTDVLTAGEKGTRALELKNVWDKLGWTQQRIDAELKKNPWERNPVPFADQVAALEIASQITHNVHQMGYDIRQLNRSTPFLGAHIAGVYKDITTFAKQPKKVMGSLAILAMAKTAEYLLNNDDPEWNELPDHYRFGFSFKTPFGWLHLPAPRGISGVLTGLMDWTTRLTGDHNPRFAQLATHAFEELAPRVAPEPLNTAVHVAANRNWLNKPIIPDREANRLSMGERFRHPDALRHMASQFSGGILDPKRLSLNPFAMDQHPHQTIFDFKEELQKAEIEHDKLGRAGQSLGRQVSASPNLKTMRQADQTIRKLEAEFHKDGTTKERQTQIRRAQTDLARRVLALSEQ